MTDKQKRYRQKCISEGRCPHCGKPCAPYYECDTRRLYKKKNSMISIPSTQFAKKEEISLQKLQIPILFSHKKMGLIEIPKPLSEEEWGRMITILKAFKPSLVEEKELMVTEQFFYK